jgi:hypothetical protein
MMYDPGYTLPAIRQEMPDDILGYILNCIEELESLGKKTLEYDLNRWESQGRPDFFLLETIPGAIIKADGAYQFIYPNRDRMIQGPPEIPFPRLY